MRTEIKPVEIPAALRKVVGQRREGTSSYYREGNNNEHFEWYKALSDRFALVDPGSASRLVGVSRNAVYKNIKVGLLTAFFFKAPKKRLELTQTTRGKAVARVSIKFPSHVECLLAFSECEQWRQQIEFRKNARRVAPFGGRGVMVYPPNFTVEVKPYGKTGEQPKRDGKADKRKRQRDQ